MSLNDLLTYLLSDKPTEQAALFSTDWKRLISQFSY